MTLEDVRRILRENNIDENRCVVLAPRVLDGVLTLLQTEDGRWRVVFAERGTFSIDQTFDEEDAALRYFLKHCLSDPVCRKDFKQSDLPSNYEEFGARKRLLLEKYGLT